MENLRAIRQRIRSVENTQKITRAMEMVAGAKLRRAEGELVSLKPYAERIQEMAKRYVASQPNLSHPLLALCHPRLDRGSVPRFREDEACLREDDDSPSPSVGLLVITSDTGLCSVYNDRIIETAQNFLKENPSAQVVAVGKKGHQALLRLGITPIRAILDWSGRYHHDQSVELLRWIEERYHTGEVATWWAAYTQFVSALRVKPAVELLLPMEMPVETQQYGPLPRRVLVEPNTAELTDALLNRALQVRFKQLILEALSSEHSARMMAMRNATENASEMIDRLTLVRNKVRQASITKELIEVVSGAQASQ